MDDEFENDNAVGDPPESLLEQVVNRMGAETLLEGNGDDVHALLLQRENDLLLAAQLGKSLMEKNHFLQEQQKQLTEEYTFRLEVIFHISIRRTCILCAIKYGILLLYIHHRKRDLHNMSIERRYSAKTIMNLQQN